MKVYNGCWGEGGISFSKLVRHNIEMFPQYDPELAYALWVNLELSVCKPHDEDFYVWGGLLAYLIANIKFTSRFCRKLCWTKLHIQLLLVPIVLIGINIFWVKYFHWTFPWNKREIPQIID